MWSLRTRKHLSQAHLDHWIMLFLDSLFPIGLIWCFHFMFVVYCMQLMVFTNPPLSPAHTQPNSVLPILPLTLLLLHIAEHISSSSLWWLKHSVAAGIVLVILKIAHIKCLMWPLHILCCLKLIFLILTSSEVIIPSKWLVSWVSSASASFSSSAAISCPPITTMLAAISGGSCTSSSRMHFWYIICFNHMMLLVTSTCFIKGFHILYTTVSCFSM